VGKVVLYLYPMFEEYAVKAFYYSDEGRLAESWEFKEVKNVVITAKQVSLSRQLAKEPLAIVVDVERPVVEFKGGVLKIAGGGRE